MQKRIGLLLISLAFPLLLLNWLNRQAVATQGANTVLIPDVHKDQMSMIYTQYVITSEADMVGTLLHTFFEPAGSILGQEQTMISPGAALTYDLASFGSLPPFFVGYIEVAADIPITGIALCGSTTPPLVAYEATPRRGAPPLTVDFTNTTCGNYDTLLWSFGDGTVSFSQNPSNVYEEIGSYTVTLTVFGPNFSRSTELSNHIQVRPEYFLPIITRP